MTKTADIPIAILGSAEDLANEVKKGFDELLESRDGLNVTAVEIEEGDLVFKVEVPE